MQEIKGTASLIGRSFQIQLGVWGRCEPPSKSRAAPWRRPRGAEPPEALKILHFTVPKMGLKLMHFCLGIVLEIIRIGRQNISQKITFIFYTNEGVRNP